MRGREIQINSVSVIYFIVRTDCSDFSLDCGEKGFRAIFDKIAAYRIPNMCITNFIAGPL